MIPGLNHNIVHNGTMYHIQTEDGGERNPTITTHLFIDGTILATERGSYKEHIGKSEGELREQIIKMMTKSHRMMINKLVTGGYDEELNKSIVTGKKKKKKKKKKDDIEEEVTVDTVAEDTGEHDVVDDNDMTAPMAAPMAEPMAVSIDNQITEPVAEPTVEISMDGANPMQSIQIDAPPPDVEKQVDSSNGKKPNPTDRLSSNMFEGGASLNLYVLFGYQPPTDTEKPTASMRKRVIELLRIEKG